jgi:hypothetical protein
METEDPHLAHERQQQMSAGSLGAAFLQSPIYHEQIRQQFARRGVRRWLGGPATAVARRDEVTRSAQSSPNERQHQADGLVGVAAMIGLPNTG